MSNVEDIYAWHASSWYLTNVSDKYGNVLFSLSYDRGPYVIQAYNAFPSLIIMSIQHLVIFLL